MKTIFAILSIALCFNSIEAQNDIFKAKKKNPELYLTSLIDHFSERDNPRMALYYTLQLGDSARNVGDLAEAEKQYIRALDYTQKIIAQGGRYRNILLESIFNPYERLGNIYIQSNNLRKAELFFTKARDEKDKYLPRSSVFRVSPHIGLGRINILRGNLEQANLDFLTAEKILNSSTTSFYDFGIPQREILLNHYEVLMKQKKFKDAYRYLKKLSFGGTSGGDQIPRIFQLKADYYLQTGNYKQCEYYLKKAKLYSQNIPLSTVNFKILRTRAILSWAQKKHEEATNAFDQLVASYKKYIQQNFTSMTEYERESFYALLHDDFDLFNAFAIQTSNEKSSVKNLGKLYDNQLFSKALLLNEINKLKNQIKNSSDEQLKSNFLEWESQKALLTNLYFAKRKNPLAINEAEARIEQLEQILNTNALQSESLPKSWKEIQSILRPGEAAIEIIRIKKFSLTGKTRFEFNDSVAYAAMIIDLEMRIPKLVVIENGNDLENKYLNYYRNSILLKQTDTLSYNNFWKPIQNKLGKYNKLFVSSDGVYNQINLNILYNVAAQNYLLDEIDLTFVTNTKDLLRPNRNIASKKCDLFGRPNYQSDSLVSLQPVKSQRPLKNRSIASEAMENFREQEFADLPGTEEEIKSLEILLLANGWDAKTNLGEEASEANMKASNNPSVLHIATHGFFLNANDQENINSMIRSGIILAGVNNSVSRHEDGILTAYEATNLKLDSTFLVVLSACETGLGDVKNGEGVYGLQRGFIVAGTKYLLMSLWKIDDEATALLMELVYTEWLKSGDLPLAVKTAQLLLRKQYPQPFYWGSFILLGN